MQQTELIRLNLADDKLLSVAINSVVFVFEGGFQNLERNIWHCFRVSSGAFNPDVER